MTRLGFLIDNRRCIGCHACTVACKSEHDVPVGVNRTWVKQVETGEFPDVRRSFHVMRCNHCADSPCTTICPVSALYVRGDGIVDFDNRRCIGCKACMQACPYDALYIDPRNQTAAKCNFCSHRVDRGLEPACVVACPEQAIVAGDLADPASLIARLVATEPVQVRCAEKGTLPSLFYIEGRPAALDPLASTPPGRGNTVDVRPLQGLGVAGFLDAGAASAAAGEAAAARRVYDAPKAGVLWGWQVSAYVLTKAVAAGVLLLPLFALTVLGQALPRERLLAFGLASLGLQAATGALLVADLKRPERFLYVLLRGNPDSWLVRGAWILTAYGLASSLWLLQTWRAPGGAHAALSWATWLLALPTAVYTAFLFRQAKARDLWQSPLTPLHMLGHALVGGAAACLLLAPGWELARPALAVGI
ncbi:MAG TPA: 4Fe-4S dicluster domain-containing protein, partial [Planctomycetota bacterium]|nr:4Fe-4S dicluster domain-containing protein [Planctomycetota bacterium]